MKPDMQKDPEAMNLIGYMYNHGLGVQKNTKDAYKWYRKAAEAGSATAQFNLGLKPDPQEARRWYDMADKAREKEEY